MTLTGDANGGNRLMGEARKITQVERGTADPVQLTDHQ